MKTYTVYFLSSSEHPDIPVYVGETCQPLKQRLAKYKDTYSQKVLQWRTEVYESGYEVLITPIVENIPSIELSMQMETLYIKLYREQGFELLNITDGGRTNNTYKRSEERKRIHLEASRRKPVMQILNGEIIETYKSINDARRKTGISDTAISFCINGRCKTASGFEWMRTFTPL